MVIVMVVVGVILSVTLIFLTWIEQSFTLFSKIGVTGFFVALLALIVDLARRYYKERRKPGF